MFGCVCMLLSNFVSYAFLQLRIFCYVHVLLLLCTFRSGYSVSLCCCVLFACKCVLDYYHWVLTQFQVTNVSYSIISYRPVLHCYRRNLYNLRTRYEQILMYVIIYVLIYIAMMFSNCLRMIMIDRNMSELLKIVSKK